MTWNFTRFMTFSFVFFFYCFLAVHFAWVKTPSQYRGLASDRSTAHLMYDASFKI